MKMFIGKFSKNFKKDLALSLSKGFTLVELLIVITIIAILSVAVLSTINPIEQANKAGDSRNKNDAAEILSAVERYYASKQAYPWMDTVTFSDAVASVDTAVGYEAKDPGVGLCSGTTVAGTPTCTTSAPGVLISQDELKTTFLNKSFIQNNSGQTVSSFFLYKEASSGAGIYVCYIPKAKSNRTFSATTNILYKLTISSGRPTAIVAATGNSAASAAGTDTLCPGINNAGWATLDSLNCFVCVP
jgi:prepilin-type N-terminal cleavage/methylation domain-containing protein